MFFIIEDTDIASYADGNTPYVIVDDIDGIIKSLEEVSEILFIGFSDNLIKIDADKCHLLVSTNNTAKIKTGDFDTSNSKSEKLLGVQFDHKLPFDDHISESCKKTSRKIHLLSRAASYMNISKRGVLINALFKSQFRYCLRVLICYSRDNNAKINRLHKQTAVV